MNGQSSYDWEYDFFERDHLGNTRVLLSQEKDTAQYMATMEAAYRSKELALFYNVDSTSYPAASVPGGYPADGTTSPNDSVARVSGSPGGHKMGPAILLKVMSGDSLGIGIKSFYRSNGSPGGNNNSLPDVLNSLAQGLIAVAGPGHGTAAGLENPSGGPVYAALNSFLPANETSTIGKPKAYLNWMLLDNQFNYVSGGGQSGAIPVGSADVLNALAQGIGVHHSGYLYIWVSNETQNWDVFFDNLSVSHYSGPMVEENHYYPFGLSMAGISDKALKGNYFENKYRFNKGSELQNKEFADGSGLELYETPLRSLDPQLGRWWQIDSKPTEAESPYSAMGNNPILLSDPGGDEACCKGLWDAVKVGSLMFASMTMESSKKMLTGPGTNLALGAMNTTGSTLSGGLNALSLNTWPANPALSIAGVNTGYNSWAFTLGQLAMSVPLGGEGITPDLNLSPAGGGLSIPSATTFTPSLPNLTVYAGKQTADMAKEGADLAGITQNTTRIPAPSGKASYRVPDELTQTGIGDVKLVDKLHFSSQIKDMLAYAQDKQIPFTLYARGGERPTRFTPQLQEQIDQGKILLQLLIPGIK